MNRWGMIMALLLAACHGVPEPQTARMAGQVASTTALPVASPAARPLFLVITETAVAPDLPIENTPHSISGFDAFVGRSLQEWLAPHFTSVEVVSSAAAAPPEPHFVAELTVARVTGKPLEIEGSTETALLMDWSFSLRASESPTPVFTAAGQSVSDSRYATLEEGVRNMTSSALELLAKVWSDKGVDALLRSIASRKAQ